MIQGNFESQLDRMVKSQLKKRGIEDTKLLNAFRSNPRHIFVPENQKGDAYSDRPLPIGEGQTISQPYIVALMTSMLSVDSKDRVLEIGTGSGYQTAILASLAGEVYTVERKRSLSKRAKNVLSELGRDNINYRVGDGTRGWAEYAPYEKIIGTGSVPEIPESLVKQLAENGRLVIPVGGERQQRLTLLIKEEGEVEIQKKSYCSFLPLIGEEGWKET